MLITSPKSLERPKLVPPIKLEISKGCVISVEEIVGFPTKKWYNQVFSAEKYSFSFLKLTGNGKFNRGGFLVRYILSEKVLSSNMFGICFCETFFGKCTGVL